MAEFNWENFMAGIGATAKDVMAGSPTKAEDENKKKIDSSQYAAILAALLGGKTPMVSMPLVTKGIAPSPYIGQQPGVAHGAGGFPLGAGEQDSALLAQIQKEMGNIVNFAKNPGDFTRQMAKEIANPFITPTMAASKIIGGW